MTRDKPLVHSMSKSVQLSNVTGLCNYLRNFKAASLREALIVENVPFWSKIDHSKSLPCVSPLLPLRIFTTSVILDYQKSKNNKIT